MEAMAYTKDEYETDLHDYLTDISEEKERNLKKINLCLETVKKVTGQEFYNDVVKYIDDESFERTFDMSIVSTIPSGVKYQLEPEYCFGGVFIDQTCGVCGDDYRGVIAILVSGHVYLTWSFTS